MSTVSAAPKSRIFEDVQIPTADGELLHAKLMVPRPSIQPQRVVFISPLVGAGAGQPLLTFREFARRGSILISIEYRGHPQSSGKFELDKTLGDVQDALIWSWNYANDRGLPLHGFATCYGTAPLLAQFKGDGCGHLLKSINTVSGLYRLDQILRVENFAPIFARHLGRELTPAGFLAGVAQNAFNWDELAFREALREYLTGLFPELRVGLNYFEELQYDRVNIPQTLLQLAQAHYFDGVDVPPEIPCNVFFGRGDDILSTHTPEGRKVYRDRVLALVPHATLHEHDFDHYGRGVDHDAVIRQVGDIFARFDKSEVPPHHLTNIFEVRGVRR